MTLNKFNATVGVSRPGSYNSGTKQTPAPAPVSGLSAVPVFIEEFGLALRAKGLAPEYDLKILWDPPAPDGSGFDIRDGDLITGYNPLGASVAPVLRVERAAYRGLGSSLACGVAMLRALKPAGSST